MAAPHAWQRARWSNACTRRVVAARMRAKPRRAHCTTSRGTERGLARPNHVDLKKKLASQSRRRNTPPADRPLRAKGILLEDQSANQSRCRTRLVADRPWLARGILLEDRI